MPHWLIVVLLVAWPAYLAVLGVWIVMQRSEPVATLGWLMALAFLPYVGFVIYYVLGPQRIRRAGRRRDASHDAVGARGKSNASGDMGALDRMAQAMTGYPPTTASRVDLLIDGAATYDALVTAIAAAQRHVHVEYYIYAGDRTGTRVRDALVERARAGVKVRVLLDGVGSRLKRSFVAPLADAGVELAFFHPVRWWATAFSRPKLNMRTHRKIVICDGTVAFTGGINVTDDENDALNADAYHDLHMRIEGDAVRWLQTAWLEDWHYATQKTLGDSTLFADAAPGPIATHVIPAGPDNAWEPVHRMQVEAIHQAERRVWLATPYFVPSRAALFALEGAAMRGLDVRVVIPKRSDSRLVTAAARSYFDKLLEAGVRVYEYGPRMLHSKVLLVDDDMAMIGTSNFDTRSFALNFEIVMLFCNAGVATELEKSLLADMAKSGEVTAGSRKPPFASRLSEAVARLFSPML
ncbi:cardiolipin synthase [Cognatilysobacter lacus]|uniref:Cardiolipin synthase n=1 Tax=Cognatilysobacter lacus TaxID=1643323 RepID=A0A5D8Z7V1_9GAMM|nr:cardiolipin synthase [Lysobacter lacus]TZF90202.1 cardiolipin synthase [Lysobacter lacus]